MTLINEELFYVSLGENLKERRKNRNLTQSELAKKLSVSRTSITNMESGNQKIPLHMLYSIAIELKVEPSDLLPDLGEVVEKNGGMLITAGDKQEDVDAKSADAYDKIMKRSLERSQSK